MTDVKPPIADVLEHYGFELPLYRNPNGHKVKCAFHGDRNASAVLNESRQYYFCFTCDRKGDSWQLIMDEEGCDFRGAIKMAADMGWVEVDAMGEVVLGGGDNAATNPKRRREGRTRLRRKRRGVLQ